MEKDSGSVLDNYKGKKMCLWIIFISCIFWLNMMNIIVSRFLSVNWKGLFWLKIVLRLWFCWLYCWWLFVVWMSFCVCNGCILFMLVLIFWWILNCVKIICWLMLKVFLGIWLLSMWWVMLFNISVIFVCIKFNKLSVFGSCVFIFYLLIKF